MFARSVSSEGKRALYGTVLTEGAGDGLPTFVFAMRNKDARSAGLLMTNSAAAFS